MTTKGIRLTRQNDPDSVCHHSGTSKDACPFRAPDKTCRYHLGNPKPTPCNVAWVGFPNLHEIYEVRTVEVRARWTEYRHSTYESERVEIPTCHRVTDHMRREMRNEN